MKYLVTATVFIFTSSKAFSQLASDAPAPYQNYTEKGKPVTTIKFSDSTLMSSKKTVQTSGTTENKKQKPLYPSASPVSALPPKTIKPAPHN